MLSNHVWISVLMSAKHYGTNILLLTTVHRFVVSVVSLISLANELEQADSSRSCRRLHADDKSTLIHSSVFWPSLEQKCIWKKQVDSYLMQLANLRSTYWLWTFVVGSVLQTTTSFMRHSRRAWVQFPTNSWKRVCYAEVRRVWCRPAMQGCNHSGI